MPYINGKGVKSSGPLKMSFSADLFMGRKNVLRRQNAPKKSARFLVLDMLMLFFPSCSGYKKSASILRSGRLLKGSKQPAGLIVSGGNLTGRHLAWWHLTGDAASRARACATAARGHRRTTAS